MERTPCPASKVSMPTIRQTTDGFPASRGGAAFWILGGPHLLAAVVAHSVLASVPGWAGLLSDDSSDGPRVPVSSARGQPLQGGGTEGRYASAYCLSDSTDKGLSVDMSGRDDLDGICNSHCPPWFLTSWHTRGRMTSGSIWWPLLLPAIS